MMVRAVEIVEERTMSTLYEVDERADTLFGKWDYCEDYLKRRGRHLKGKEKKGKEKLEPQIKQCTDAVKKMKDDGLMLSNDGIMDQFDILERGLAKIAPLIEKSDLKDYVTRRNMKEKFIQGANNPIKKLQEMEFKEWKHIKGDVDVLQELMVRLQTPFDSFEEADKHISDLKAATRVVKKRVKELQQGSEDEDEDMGGRKAKTKKKAAPAKKKGAAGKKKAAPAKKKSGAEKKKEPEKKRGWLSRKFGK